MLRALHSTKDKHLINGNFVDQLDKTNCEILEGLEHVRTERAWYLWPAA